MTYLFLFCFVVGRGIGVAGTWVHFYSRPLAPLFVGLLKSNASGQWPWAHWLLCDMWGCISSSSNTHFYPDPLLIVPIYWSQNQDPTSIYGFSAPRAQFTFSTRDVSQAFHKLDAAHRACEKLYGTTLGKKYLNPSSRPCRCNNRTLSL